ncbi:hypothetical protein BX666DRAFT_612804 [Dichotomocladium elegans]|nr:hypothetical protein BX666DRAFT_612804 [Dichotomocladium elegans]
MRLLSLAASLILPVYVLAQQQSAAMDFGSALRQLYALLDMLSRGDLDAFASFTAFNQPEAAVAATAAAASPGVNIPVEYPIPTSNMAPPQISLWTSTIDVLPTMTMSYKTIPGTTLSLPTTATMTRISPRLTATRNITVTVYPTFETTPSSDAHRTIVPAAPTVLVLISFIIAIRLCLRG